MTFRHRVCIATVLLLSGACTEPNRAARATGSGSETGDALPAVDEDEILDAALAYREQLVRVSSSPERSETHADAASVMVWANASAIEPLLSIDPYDPTQSISFDAGTTLVKEHLDEAGDPVGLTIMYKGPEGYSAETNDWFWARVRGDDVTHQGQVDWCIFCHEAAHNSDFVVGFGKSQ